MADNNTPRWRTVVDRVDSTISPAANKLVRTSVFADAVAASTRLEVQIRRRLQRQYAMLWNLVNLPTGTEQRSLRGQVASLEARLRDLTERLEAMDEGSSEG